MRLPQGRRSARDTARQHPCKMPKTSERDFRSSKRVTHLCVLETLVVSLELLHLLEPQVILEGSHLAVLC